MFINKLFALIITHGNVTGTHHTLTSFKWQAICKHPCPDMSPHVLLLLQLIHLNWKYPWYSVRDLHHLCSFLNTLDPQCSKLQEDSLPCVNLPVCHCLHFNMTYTMTVSYNYSILYYYYA